MVFLERSSSTKLRTGISFGSVILTKLDAVVVYLEAQNFVLQSLHGPELYKSRQTRLPQKDILS